MAPEGTNGAAAFAAVVERERQVPVVERDERRDVLRVERVEQAVEGGRRGREMGVDSEKMNKYRFNN